MSANELESKLANKPSQPQKVKRAVQLLYICLGYNFVQIIAIAMYAMGRNGLSLEVIPVVGPALSCVPFILVGLVIYMISMGKNWARIVYLAWFVYGVLSLSWMLFSGFDTGDSLFELLGSRSLWDNYFFIGSQLLTVVKMIVEIVALVFLFQKPSSDWFRQMKQGA